MKLKLDLHPIYNDSQKIETALLSSLQEALQNRITELEIIPGKGSGQLKKAVLRFLDRPEIKSQYHRIEKDGDNWGRLFVHFRWERLQEGKAAPVPRETATYDCFACAALVTVAVSKDALREDGQETRIAECPSCGSPNRVTLSLNRRSEVQASAESGYEV